MRRAVGQLVEAERARAAPRPPRCARRARPPAAPGTRRSRAPTARAAGRSAAAGTRAAATAGSRPVGTVGLVADLARVRRLPAGEQHQQRRLARARAAEQHAPTSPRRSVERRVADRLDRLRAAAEALADAARPRRRPRRVPAGTARRSAGAALGPVDDAAAVEVEHAVGDRDHVGVVRREHERGALARVPADRRRAAGRPSRGRARRSARRRRSPASPRASASANAARACSPPESSDRRRVDAGRASPKSASSAPGAPAATRRARARSGAGRSCRRPSG